MLLMLNGWEILLLGITVLLLIGVPLTIAAIVLWVALRKKDFRPIAPKTADPARPGKRSVTTDEQNAA